MWSVVIVNYNSGQMVGSCVKSLLALGVKLDIIVVDNLSTDDSLSHLMELDCRILRLNQNYGFARACNEGAKISIGEWVHFLNPDCVVHSNLIELYESKYILDVDVLYSTQIYDLNGCRHNPVHPVPYFWNYILCFVKSNRAKYWAIGASVFAHRSHFSRLNWWPEDYFMYSEDLDLGFQSNISGRGVRLFDETSVMHIGGGVTRNIWSEHQRMGYVFRSQNIFYAKYRMYFSALFVEPLIKALYAISSKSNPFVVLNIWFGQMLRIRRGL